jgi:hypothetical protein
MSTEAPVVNIKIQMDSSAQADAKKLVEDMEKPLKDGQEHISDLLGKIGEGFKERIGQQMADFATGTLHAALESIKELPGEAFAAWAESEEQVRGLAGTLGVLDQNANSYDGIKNFAADIKDELEEVAMATGSTDDALVAVFDNVISRGGKSVDQAKALTSQMAQAGKSIPGGAVALSEAFEQLQMGIIKAKNPLVGMISASGLVHGNAKQVAKALQGMGVDKQMELAEAAIGKMSTKMEKVPLTFEQARNSLSVFKGNIFEGMGQPIYDAMTRGMNVIKDKFIEADGSATALGQRLLDAGASFGEVMGHGVDAATDFAGGFLETASIEAKGIADAWNEAFANGDESFADWKQAGKEIAQSLGSVAKGAVEGGGGIKNWIADKASGSDKQMGMFDNILGATLGDFNTGFWDDLKQSQVSSRADETLSKARKTGGGDQAALHDQYIKDAVDGMGMAMEDAERNFANAIAWRTDEMHGVAAAQTAAQKGDTEAYVKAYLEASKFHDDAAMTNIAKFLATNKEMADAIAWAGPNLLGEASGDFLKSLDKAGLGKMGEHFKNVSWKPDLGIQGKSPTVNFNGNTFHIKQDFKDQDPDRIAVVFRNDIGKHAGARVQSRGINPLGF